MYLIAASAYTGAIVLSQHLDLADHADWAIGYMRAQGIEGAIALKYEVLVPGWRFVRGESDEFVREVQTALEPAVVTPQRRVVESPRAVRHVAANLSYQMRLANTPVPRTDALGLRMSEDIAFPPPAVSSPPRPSPARRRVAGAAHTHLELAPQTEQTEDSLPPTDNAPSAASAVANYLQPTTAEIAQVQQRLKDNLTSEMVDNFELFLFVNKAGSGPWAQRMYVFQKEPTTGDLALAYSWPVSTGREKFEFNPAGRKLSSFTPRGYYELDPHRLFTHHWSSQWDEPMPYAMFFNWKKDGHDTGIAIHGATGDNVDLLGTRASAGCIRLPPEAARTLFNLIRSKYRGLAPQFAIDHRTGTMSNDGIILHDADGQVQLADGYKVLVFIEDYGGENVVAAIY